MRNFLLTGFAFAFLAFAAAPAAAQEMEMAETTDAEFEATVVDLSCKLVYNLGGDGHRECSQMCADAGIPLGLMTDDGKFYLPVSQAMAQSPFGQLRPHAEHRVTVKGKVIERAGMNSIIIEDISMQ